MNAILMLCEAATGHPDGTISMLRAGIDQVRAPAEPIPFQGALVVRMEAEIGDTGEHQFDLQCLDQDGKLVLPPLNGRFSVPTVGGTNHLILGLALRFPKVGEYVFYFRVDNKIESKWKAKAGLLLAQQPKEGGNDH